MNNQPSNSPGAGKVAFDLVDISQDAKSLKQQSSFLQSYFAAMRQAPSLTLTPDAVCYLDDMLTRMDQKIGAVADQLASHSGVSSADSDDVLPVVANIGAFSGDEYQARQEALFGDFLALWLKATDGRSLTTHMLVQAILHGPPHWQQTTLQLLPTHSVVDTRTLGYLLRSWVGRAVNGLILVRGPKSRRGVLWWVHPSIHKRGDD